MNSQETAARRAARVTAIEEPRSAAIQAALERSWWPVCRSEDLPGPLAVTLLERALVAYRGSDGFARVADDRCPHRGAALSAGAIVDLTVACPYHGWQWDGTTGSCVRIPSLEDQSRIPVAAQLRTYPVIERWGLVWTCLADEPLGPVPEPDWLRDLEWEYLIGIRDVETNVLFVAENFRDVAHFAFVHPETVPIDSPEIEPLHPETDGFHVRLQRPVVPAEQGPAWFSAEPYTARYHAIAPNFLSYRADFADQGVAYLLHCPSPISLERTRTFFVRGLAPEHRARLPEFLAAEDQITREDAAVVSTCTPRRLGESLDHQVHTLADVYSLAYRRAFYAYVEAASVGAG